MTGQTRTELGKVIASIRISKKYSQEALGALAGVHQNSVDRIENARGGLRVDTFMQIAAGLGIPAWKILRYVEKSQLSVDSKDCTISEAPPVSSSF